MSDLMTTFRAFFPTSFRASGLATALALFVCLIAASEAFAQNLDLAVTKTAAATAAAGSNISYTITISNNGPSNSNNTQLNDSVPANTTFVSITQDSGPTFTCTSPASGAATGTVTCTGAITPVQTAQFTLVLNVNPGTANGTIISNTARVQDFFFLFTDPQGNNQSIARTTVTTTPTAATVSVSGRVMTASGRGIRNVVIRLTDSEGNLRTAISNSFGYYRFNDVEAGATYILTATGKRFSFSQPSQVLNINDETDGVNFIGSPFNR